MRHRQQGIALVGVLAIIPIAALVALMGLERSLLHTRMEGTARDRIVALEVAEVALRGGAESAVQWARPPLEPAPAPSAASWRAAIRQHGRVLSRPAMVGTLHQPPAVLVERLSPTGAADCAGSLRCGYRLSVLAYGRAPGTDVVLQAVIADQSAVRTWRELR